MTIIGTSRISQRAARAAIVLLGMGAALIGAPGLEPAWAQDSGTAAPAAPASGGLRALVYVPHDFDAPEVSEAGGVRGLATPPQVHLLAPPTLAVTAVDQPTLYWYLSTEAPMPVRLVIQDASVTEGEPLLTVDLPAVAQSGVYGLALADHGVRLGTEQTYRWSLVLGSPDQGAAGMATTTLQRITADPALLASVEGAAPLDQVELLAARGYWYDAIHRLSALIAAGDQSQPWRWYRADLLEQVGLAEIAAYDRDTPN